MARTSLGYRCDQYKLMAMKQQKAAIKLKDLTLDMSNAKIIEKEHGK